jgi:hypothetical protein
MLIEGKPTPIITNNMGILKKLFGGTSVSQPLEPVFPGESFSILKLDYSDGWGLATVNNAYDNYPNKSFYPWHVLIEIEVIDQNQNGHPTITEAEKLNNIEKDIENLMKQSQTVHFVARIIKNGFRELLYYIDQPRLKQGDLNAFCDNIMKERGINFTMQEDPLWKLVDFIK